MGFFNMMKPFKITFTVFEIKRKKMAMKFDGVK